MMSQTLVPLAPETAEEATPYVVAIRDGSCETAIALCSSSAVAYAAYFAAAREHFGRSLRLRCGERVLADTRLN